MIDSYDQTLRGLEYLHKPLRLMDTCWHDIADLSGTDGLTLSASILALAKRRF